MNVLKKGARIRRNLLAKATVQFIAAAGLTISGLGVRTEPMVLVLCLAIAAGLGYAGLRTLDHRRKFEAQAKAEAVLRDLVPELEERGFKIARYMRLPADCRDYLVVFTPSTELAFVIGLAGMWPGRASLEGPQRVATELSAYGTPHVPVILAAFMDGYLEDYPFGVLAVTPQRLAPALEDVEAQFLASRDETLAQLRAVRHNPSDQERRETVQW